MELKTLETLDVEDNSQGRTKTNGGTEGGEAGYVVEPPPREVEYPDATEAVGDTLPPEGGTVLVPGGVTGVGLP